MKILPLLLAALLGPTAFAASEPHYPCDNGTDNAKMKARALEIMAASPIGEGLDASSATMTSYIPQAVRPAQTAPLVVVAKFTLSGEQGAETSLWAVQFAVDETSCTPTLTTMGKLE